MWHTSHQIFKEMLHLIIHTAISDRLLLYSHITTTKNKKRKVSVGESLTTGTSYATLLFSERLTFLFKTKRTLNRDTVLLLALMLDVVFSGLYFSTTWLENTLSALVCRITSSTAQSSLILLSVN